MSKIIVNQIESSDGTTDVLNSLSAVSVAGAGIGQVLQVASTFSNTHVAVTTSTPTNVGLSATLTPSSSSSKILVTFNGMTGSSSNDSSCGISLYRHLNYPSGSAGFVGVGDNGSNNSQVEVGTASFAKDSLPDSAGITFLDSPNTTDEVAYTIYLVSRSGSYTSYLNRTGTNANATYSYSGGSSITLMEIAG